MSDLTANVQYRRTFSGLQRISPQPQSAREMAAGDIVILPSGRPVTVTYVSSRMNVARVRTADGTVRTVKLSLLQPQSRKSEIRLTISNAHPVPGQIPQVSDRVKMRDEPELEGKPGPVDPTQAQRVGRKDTRSGRQIVQPTTSPVQNERLAAVNAPELETKLSAISSTVPGAKFERLRPQKNLDRVQQKVKEGKPAQTISDYLAAQISADTPQAKDQILQELRKEFHVIQVDDKFLKGRPDKGGYPSANVQVKFPNGGTAEVQIVPREAQQITDATHHLYKEGRNARDAGDTTRARQALEQARKLNQEALKQFQRRNQLSKGQIVTLTNGDQATVQYVSPAMNVVRVRTAQGKTRTVRLNQIQEAANE